jgi:hypothetical protein
MLLYLEGVPEIDQLEITDLNQEISSLNSGDANEMGGY